MAMENSITNSNLLVIQLLSLIDSGHIVDIDEMTAQIAKYGLDKYLIETCNTRLTVGDKGYFELISTNLIKFWNAHDNEEFGIKRNGLIYLIFSLMELNRVGYGNDL